MRLPRSGTLKGMPVSAERETVSGVNQAGFRLPSGRGVAHLWLKASSRANDRAGKTVGAHAFEGETGAGKLVSMGSEPHKQSSARSGASRRDFPPPRSPLGGVGGEAGAGKLVSMGSEPHKQSSARSGSSRRDSPPPRSPLGWMGWLALGV